MRDRSVLVIGEHLEVTELNREGRDASAPLALWYDLDTGRSVPVRKPSTTMSYRGLRAVALPDGSTLALWSETAGESTRDTTGGVGATQVWAARILRDSTTPPRFIFASREATWERLYTVSNVVVDSSGTVHLLILATSSPTRRPFVHLQLKGSVWRVDVPDVGREFFPLHHAMQILDNSLHVFLTSLDMSLPQPVGASLFHLTRSLVDSTWSESQLLYDGSERPADYTYVMVGPSRELRVLWFARPSPTEVFVSRDVRSAFSRDGGRTFVTAEGPELSEPLLWYYGDWTDRCGVTNLHVGTGYVGGNTWARTLTWQDGRIVEGPRFSHDYLFVGRSTVASNGSDLIVRIWSSAFVAPMMPIILMWFESHQSLAVPRR